MAQNIIDLGVKFLVWGHSSAGRAPAWHAGGQRFKSAWLHNYYLVEAIMKKYSRS
ncbi:Hypothetical protein P9211_13041 [Prochlorococcus marinus str. MIT 9211]|uniref:Uncharacterized protein n=1 Tax=Prochlorococcus marinus (strain MIT 9211) TaxID=93059 RepID=A9BBM3_PROM4|nr:Hypothetical protein P9211_13041 [Prochlorococcus marinus str. MIT 9211]